MKSGVLLVVFLAGTLLVAWQEASTGAVEGTVVDDNARPVAGVKVYALAEGNPSLGAEIFATTDDGGHFVLQRLPPGENRLFPVVSGDKYPDGRWGIFAGDASLYRVVNVEPGRTIASVVIKLPKKGALLRAHISDASTGQSVLTARVRITRPDLPTAFYESGPDLDGGFEIVLLPNVSFRIQVRATDYKPWSYSRLDSEGNESPNLVLRQDATEEIAVKLEPMGSTSQ